MGTKSFFLLSLLFVVSAFSLYGQEAPAQVSGETAPVEAPAEAVPDTAEYVIREMDFDIKGRTRSFYIVSNGEFEEGERIQGKANLDRYIARKTQLLLNQRVLEKASIEYTLGTAEADGALPVKLLIHTEDSWNFIILPYPKYDSNNGLSITLKGRDYNFLGTMSALRVDLGYRRDPDSENHFNFMLDSDTPFQALGLDWIVNFDHIFEYTLDDPLYYQNITGLSVKLPAGFTDVTLGFNQYLTFNQEIADENKFYNEPGEEFYSPYGTTELYSSWNIPLGIAVGDFGELSYTPGLSGRINYPYGSMDEPRKPVTSLSHSVKFGRTDWIGNFRKELSASVGNAFSWFFDRDDAPLAISLNAGATVHWPFSKYFGVSSRINYRQWWQWSDRNDAYLPYYYAGDLIRGVIDEDIRADYMLSLNLEFPVRVLRFWPSEWFNKPGLHFFDFEMFFSPFTDLALLQGPWNDLKQNVLEGSKFSFDDMINTVGLEVIVFSGFFRSLRLRGSVGYDLKKIKDKGIDYKWGFFPQWDEIYIGLDHHF